MAPTDAADITAAFFERLFDRSLDGMMLTHPDGHIVRANASACRLLERSEQEICRLGRQGLVVDEPDLRELLSRRSTEHEVAGRLRFRRPDGTTFPADFTSGQFQAEGALAWMYVIFRDVSARVQEEERLHRAHRALALVTRCTEAVLLAESEPALFDSVCRVMVETGGYLLCWVGLAETDAARTVRPVARAGRDDGYLDSARITWAEEPRGRGPVGTAVRERYPMVAWDVADDPRLAPWRDEALARGFHRCTAIPLVLGNTAVGVLAMYSGDDDAFDHAEYALITRLAESLARGVQALRDRDARAAAEAQVRRSEGLLRGIADTVPEPLFLKDTESRWLFVNRATLEVVGRTMEQVLGRSDREIFPDPAVGEALMAVDRRIMTSGQAEIIEEAVQTPTGLRVYESTKAPFRDADGRVIGLVGNARDVTAHHREELERRRLSTAIEQAAEAVVITDPVGAIHYVNPAFERVSGYARAEVLGRNPRFLKSGTQDASFYRALWDTLLKGTTWQGRLINRRKDGALFTEDASISPVRDDTGRLLGYVAVKRDVTHDLALEAQLRQSQKMEGLGQLAGGVAHDFNNALSVILSLAEVTQASLPPDDPLREDVKEMEQAAARAATLTRQLLAFSRKQVLQPTLLEPNRLITDLGKMLARLLGEPVQLVLHLAQAVGVVRADPGQLEQVVVNLAVNARDAMPRGGTLTISSEGVDVDAALAAEHPGLTVGPAVRLRFTDTGTGMDEATRARIFEPFFTTKAQGKGTGLGLSTVYGIVTQSGGGVVVRSAPGRGTTFEVYLPRVLGLVAEAPSAPLVPLQRTGTERVLVVEDDEAVRNVTRRVLTAAGYQVQTAANGGEALLLEEQAATPFDLVVTDVVMPLMGGRAVVERLRRHTPRLKALYMSGYPDTGLTRGGALEPGLHFVPKPFTPATLLKAVREALDSPAPLTPVPRPPP